MNGSTFNYQILNPTKTKSLILLHGFMGCLEDWMPVSKHLTEYKLLLIDLPGHGNTPITELNNSLETLTTHLSDFIKYFTQKPTTIVGYSLGGRIALSLLAKEPELFSSIVLESTNPGLISEQEKSDRLRSDQAIANKLTNDPLSFKDFLNSWYNHPLWGELKKHDSFEQMIENRLKQNSAMLATSLLNYSVAKQPNYRQELRNIKLPLLIVAGDKDTKYTSIARELMEFSDNIEGYIINDAGHNVHFEQRERFVATVLDFLRRHEAN